MRNKILFVLETGLFALLVYIALLNYNAQTISNFKVFTNENALELNTFFVIIACYFIGLCTGLIYSKMISGEYKKQLSMYAKKTEKLSLKNESDTDSKVALERKIASLEIALENALKKN